MGTEQALKNGISAYHYNMLKLLMDWQPVEFNAKDAAIAWRNISTGEEVNTEILSWIGGIDLRFLRRRYREIYPLSDPSDNGIGNEIDTSSDNYQLVSLLDYVIECLMQYRDESRGLITTEELNINLISRIKSMMQLYENSYVLQIESDGATTNYQYEINRRYIDRARKTVEVKQILTLNSRQLKVAREWLIDCFPVQEEEIRDASSHVIESEIIRLCGSLEALDYEENSSVYSITDASVNQNLLVPL